MLLLGGIIWSPWVQPLRAGEQDLRSLEQAKGKKKGGGAYVGVFGGSSQGQSAELAITYLNGSEFKYDLTNRSGDAMMGFEVGYSWKQKKLPLELGLEFEAFYMTTEITGQLPGENPLNVITTVTPPPFPGFPETISTVTEPYNPGPNQIPADGLVGFRTDMNGVQFMLNASATLDLRRYRPRIGKYLSNVRPYLGYGVGGAQLWFRNTTTTVKDPQKAPSVSVFEIDEFVFAKQFFAGVEYNINNRFSVYAEYRKLSLEDFDVVSDYETETWIAGIRLHY